MGLSLPIVLLVAAGLRMWLFGSHSLAVWLSERPELATPLTSWKRVTEGLALRRAGVAPYEGDVYHETPLMLRMVEFADDLLGQNMWIVLLVVDLMTALVLSRVAIETRRYLLQHQAAEEHQYYILLLISYITHYNVFLVINFINGDCIHYANICFSLTPPGGPTTSLTKRMG